MSSLLNPAMTKTIKLTYLRIVRINLVFFNISLYINN